PFRVGATLAPGPPQQLGDLFFQQCLDELLHLPADETLQALPDDLGRPGLLSGILSDGHGGVSFLAEMALGFSLAYGKVRRLSRLHTFRRYLPAAKSGANTAQQRHEGRSTARDRLTLSGPQHCRTSSPAMRICANLGVGPYGARRRGRGGPPEV